MTSTSLEVRRDFSWVASHKGSLRIKCEAFFRSLARSKTFSSHRVYKQTFYFFSQGRAEIFPLRINETQNDRMIFIRVLSDKPQTIWYYVRIRKNIWNEALIIKPIFVWGGDIKYQHAFENTYLFTYCYPKDKKTEFRWKISESDLSEGKTKSYYEQY